MIDNVKLLMNKQTMPVLSSLRQTVIVHYSRKDDENNDSADSIEIDEEEAKDPAEKSFAQDGKYGGSKQIDFDANIHAGLNDIYEIHGLMKPDQLPILASTKEILTKAEAHVGEKVWSARELLTWKIPEAMSSTGCNLNRSRFEAEFLPPPISLFKFNLVTQRIKEQLVSYCGIVTHVKQGYEDS